MILLHKVYRGELYENKTYEAAFINYGEKCCLYSNVCFAGRDEEVFTSTFQLRRRNTSEKHRYKKGRQSFS